MARYRLRFLLQEFDLPRGATILGRSSDCHVTIEDPLVSRQHARIMVRGEEATLEDLGSFGEDIVLVTLDGRFAVSRRHVFNNETFLSEDGLPVDSGVLAASPDSTELFQFDNETGALFVQALPTD